MKGLWILLMLGSVFVHGGDTFAKSTVIHVATGEWPPYVSQHMPGSGVIAEILTAVFKEMGMNPKYEFFPWKRVEQKVKD